MSSRLIPGMPDGERGRLISPGLKGIEIRDWPWMVLWVVELRVFISGFPACESAYSLGTTSSLVASCWKVSPGLAEPGSASGD